MVENKLKGAQELSAIVAGLRGEGKKIVFTNGCFDIIHRGHIHCLQEARRQGDVLIVAMNSDASVTALKGKMRPILPQEDRTVVLAALSCVDYLVIFDEPTPIDLIRRLKPDLLVKGGDWSREDIVGAPEVEGWGGRVMVVPRLEGLSTSHILERLVNWVRGAG